MKEETLEIQLKKVDHKRNEVLGPLSNFSLAALSISVVTGSIISTPSQDQLSHYIIWCVSVQYFHPLHLCSVPTPPIYPSTTYLLETMRLEEEATHLAVISADTSVSRDSRD